ncbi:MAG: FlgD immunoglobulin-like domain containing protein [Spirochaetia bacterium]
MKRILFFMLLFAYFISMGFSQYLPPDGTNELLEVTSPHILSAGEHVTSSYPPMTDIINPSSSALIQRTILDLSFIGIAGLADNPGYHGSVVNMGLSIPTPAGVFSGSGHFLTASPDGFGLGTLGGVHASFSKDLFPSFLVGAGTNVFFGYNTSFDWRWDLDLGFTHILGDIGFMKDFVWAGAFRHAGKWFDPVESRSAYPAAFTPAVGAAFSPLLTDDFELRFSSDLVFPSFQDVGLTYGMEFSFQDFVGFRLGGGITLQELLNSSLTPRSVPLSGGIFVNITTNFSEDVEFLRISERGWNRSEVRSHITAAPLRNGLWAFGAGLNIPLGVLDSQPPQITQEIQSEFISPNNDGSLDTLVIPIDIRDQRYIRGYTLYIYNSEGAVVREIENKDERPENLNFRNIIDRFLYVKTGLSVPDQLRWDGIGGDGQVVSDGNYTYVLEAWDDNGNVQRTDPVEFTVDSTAPQITVEQPQALDLIISPNGDGNKDTLVLEQDGSVEQSWQAVISNVDGEPVRTFEFEEASPSQIVWDGTDDSGVLVPDGVYQYRITSTDRALNSNAAVVENIIINTQSTPVTVTIDRAHFSPNGDSVQDTVEYTLNIPVRTGITSWQLVIEDSDQRAVRSYESTSEPPETIVFDGRDDDGDLLPEGRYRAELSVFYQNGNSPVENSAYSTLDITDPEAMVTANLEVFSPNGDGNNDTISFFQETSREEEWRGEISNDEGETVRTYEWMNRPDMRIVWNGRDSDGLLMPDGEYSFYLISTDRAGNTGSSQPVRFTLTTEETEVFLSTGSRAFSPNGDGVNDRLNIVPQIRTELDIVRYNMSVFSQEGELVREYTGRSAPPEQIVWDGLTGGGQLVGNGTYYSTIEIEDIGGAVKTARSEEFIVDITVPRITASANYRLFSPDGDGFKDAIRITQESSSENRWNARIEDSEGETVHQMVWEGNAPSFTWDGTDAEGNLLPNGSYTYTISTTDIAGNSAEAQIENIRIDIRPTTIFITVDKDGFSPNGDEYLDTMEISTMLNLQEGIESWSLEILSEADDEVIRTWTGENSVPPETITWDGLSDEGSYEQGMMYAQLSVVYLKGNRPQEHTQPFLLDISEPDVDLSITPKPFSPDNDGVDDELTISIDVDDLSQISEWELVIIDPYGEEFTRYEGGSAPAQEIIWDGRSATGELVETARDYEMYFEITDALGNTARIEDDIPVDILVVRDGDRLRIAITNITFDGGVSSLNSSDPEDMATNERVLARLAEILNRYSRYQIRIEGHARRINNDDPAAIEQEEENILAPLSLARAETVRQYLIELGVDPNRLTAVGRGGRDPLHPHTDPENAWRNRRVEFILVR